MYIYHFNIVLELVTLSNRCNYPICFVAVMAIQVTRLQMLTNISSAAKSDECNHLYEELYKANGKWCEPLKSTRTSAKAKPLPCLSWSGFQIASWRTMVSSEAYQAPIKEKCQTRVNGRQLAITTDLSLEHKARGDECVIGYTVAPSRATVRLWESTWHFIWTKHVSWNMLWNHLQCTEGSEGNNSDVP